jgi:hypothetical protein
MTHAEREHWGGAGSGVWVLRPDGAAKEVSCDVEGAWTVNGLGPFLVYLSVVTDTRFLEAVQLPTTSYPFF